MVLGTNILSHRAPRCHPKSNILEAVYTGLFQCVAGATSLVNCSTAAGQQKDAVTKTRYCMCCNTSVNVKYA